MGGFELGFQVEDSAGGSAGLGGVSLPFLFPGSDDLDFGGGDLRFQFSAGRGHLVGSVAWGVGCFTTHIIRNVCRIARGNPRKFLIFLNQSIQSVFMSKTTSKTDWPKRFAESLRGRRERMKLSREQAAELMGVSVATVQHWETGFRAPSTRELPKIAEAYGVQPATLLPRLEPEP